MKLSDFLQAEKLDFADVFSCNNRHSTKPETETEWKKHLGGSNLNGYITSHSSGITKTSEKDWRLPSQLRDMLVTAETYIQLETEIRQWMSTVAVSRFTMVPWIK